MMLQSDTIASVKFQRAVMSAIEERQYSFFPVGRSMSLEGAEQPR
jgi:hypothetical protein